MRGKAKPLRSKLIVIIICLKVLTLGQNSPSANGIKERNTTHIKKNARVAHYYSKPKNPNNQLFYSHP